MEKTNKQIEELIVEARNNVESAQAYLVTLNETMDKLSSIENIKNIVADNEQYKQDLECLEVEILEMIKSIGGRK